MQPFRRELLLTITLDSPLVASGVPTVAGDTPGQPECTECDTCLLLLRRLSLICRRAPVLTRQKLPREHHRGIKQEVLMRRDPEWRDRFFHLATRRGRKIAKVAMARRLAVRLYWMWRQGWDYERWNRFASHAGQPGHRQGVRLNTE